MARQDVTSPAWDINIVGHDVKPASWFLAHHKNVKIHPRAQQQATEGSLNTLGWVKSVTVNVRTATSWPPGNHGVQTLLDGHDRVTLALRRGEETPVPVEFVDLDEAQEDTFLLVVDALAEMAMRDKQKLDALLQTTKPADAALQQFLSELAAKEGLYQGNGTPVVPDPDPLQEPQLRGECMVELYCAPHDLDEFRETLESWGERPGVTLHISA